MTERRRSTRALLVDAALAVAVAGTVSAVISADQGGRLEPDAIAYLWAVGLGGLMLVRRRHPLVVLTVSVLGLFAYYAAGYPAVGVAVPVAAALFSAAEMGRPGWAVLAGLVVLGTSVGFRLAEGQPFSVVVGYELAGHVALMAAAVALGDGLRSRRELAGNAVRLARAAADRERADAEGVAQANRIDLARDLHDAIGHSTAVISLHAQVAAEALPAGAEESREALRIVTATVAEQSRELRRTVRVLRTPHGTDRRLGTVRDIATVASTLPIPVDTDLQAPEELPGPVADAAFHIAREALTNVVKHSDAGRVRVELSRRDGALRLVVADDGDATGSGPDGHGVTGMRERARSVGGTLDIDRSVTGFTVAATLPVEEAT